MKRKIVAMLLISAMAVETFSVSVQATDADTASSSVVSQVSSVTEETTENTNISETQETVETSETSETSEVTDPAAEETPELTEAEKIGETLGLNLQWIEDENTSVTLDENQLVMSYKAFAEDDAYTVTLYDAADSFFTEDAVIAADEEGMVSWTLALEDETPEQFYVVISDSADQAIAVSVDQNADEDVMLTAAADPTPAVTVSSVTPGDGKLTLKWAAVENAEKYVVEASAKSVEVAAVENQTTYQGVLTGLTNGTAVDVTVKAKQGDEVIASTTKKATPMKAATLTTTVGYNKVVVKWAAIAGASSYQFTDSSTGKTTTVKATTATTYSKTSSGLALNTKYTYTVKPVDASGNVGTAAAKTVTTKSVSIGKPSSLSYTEVSTGFKLTWPKVKNAKGYNVYLYNESTKKYNKLTSVTALNYTYKTTTYNTYKFMVKAYTTYTRDDTNKTAQVEGAGVTKYITGPSVMKASTSEVHSIWYQATVKATTKYYTTEFGSKVAGTIKKGTAITVTCRRLKPRNTIKLANGTLGYLSPKYINFKKQIYSTKDYTTKTKELYVNEKGFSSKTKYLFWASTYTQRVNVFTGSKGKWKLYKVFRCASGKCATPTYIGLQKTYKHIAKRGSNNFERWWTCWNSAPTAFHSIIYKKSGKVSDGRVGLPLSHGCIRLETEDAKFIYDKIPLGTTAWVY